jgi:glycosyltransferase involved in cell wall biosynthesis
MKNKTLVIIPAYNASLTMWELIRRVSKFINKEDIVVVDDGSIDQTFETAQRAGAVVLNHETNKGKGEALKTGFEYALKKHYDALFTIDADLQHDPSSIPDFLQKTSEIRTKGRNKNFDGILIGTRDIRLKKMPLARWVTNNLTSAILSVLSGQRIRDSQSGYRLISTQTLKKIKLKAKKYDLESEILVKAGRAGFKIDAVPIRTIYRGSKSFINPFVDTGRFIRLMWRSLWW